MKNLLHLFWGLIFFSASFQAYSQGAVKLRAYVFAGTDDSYIGKGIKKSLKTLKVELNRIESVTGGDIGVDINISEQAKFSISELDKVMDNLSTIDLSNDIVLFYFMGHGFMDDKYNSPNLLFYSTNGPVTPEVIEDNHINLTEIHERLKTKGARLTISIGEACNTNIEKSLESIIAEDVSKIKNQPPPVVEKERFSELFELPEGDILIQSSLKGQYSYVSEEHGSIFVQAFVAALHQVISSKYRARWSEFITYLDQHSSNLCKVAKLNDIQYPKGVFNLTNSFEDDNSEETPEVEVIVGSFKKSRLLKKQVRRMLKGKTPSKEVYDLLQRSDIAEKNIKYQPLSHYLLLGIFAENHDDDDKVLLFYSIAKNLYKPINQEKVKLTKVDYKVIKKMEKLAKRKRKKSALAKEIYEAGGVYQWINKTQKKVLEKLKEEKKIKISDLYNLYDLLANVNGQIVEEEKKIIVYNNKIKEEQAKINSNLTTIKDLRRYQKTRVSADVIDISTVKNIDYDEVRDYIDCLQKYSSEDSCQASIPSMMIAGNANIKFSMDADSITGKTITQTGNVEIGQTCDEKSEEVISNILDALFFALSKVPKEAKYMDEIKIYGTIEGLADYRGAGTLLNKTYDQQWDIDEVYLNKFDDLKEVKFYPGGNVRITNEQLAFLRAYCASVQIREKILSATDNMIDVYDESQFEIDYRATEQSKKESESVNNENRGVKIDLKVRNLYQYIEDKINIGLEENEVLQGKIKQYQALIEEYETKIGQFKLERKVVQGKIKEKKIEIKEIDKIINENDIYGSKVKQKTNQVKN